MRVFVTFGKTHRWAVDIPPEATVKDVKDIVSEKTYFDIHDDNREAKFLDIVYGGASLHEEWILQDIGINSGATLKCRLKVRAKPSLRVLLGYSDDVLDVMDEIDPSVTRISEIRSMISKQTGLPVSVYRLCLFEPLTRKLPKIYNDVTSDKLVELFDSNTIGDYGLELGAEVKLEVWDGWKEFINASLQGHEKIVGSFLTRDREERKYQRRVALYIAAHFNYAGLAQNMLRYGARPDVPVGTHPTREWCCSSDHLETKKCPVHEACEQGNLVLLKILMKSNVLCFGVRDGKGRTPWNIVVEHFHKDCFEYLLARQWARRSGKDPKISFPIMIYCQIIQWCNRARSRVLIMYGSTKSTLRGRLVRNGGLVGTTVAVDGLSNKRMSSIPLASMPKPTMHPSRMLPALAKARRRFKRENSPTYNLNRRRSVHSRRSSRVSFQRAASIAESERSSIFDTPELAKYALRSQIFESSQQGSIAGSIWGDKEFSAISKGDDTGTNAPKEGKRPKSRPIVPARASIVINGEKVKGISLPIMSLPEYRRPYAYWGDCIENPVENTLSRFETYRGTSSRENAIKCLTLTDTFVRTAWLKRAGMAVCLAKRGVKKNTELLV